MRRAASRPTSESIRRSSSDVASIARALSRQVLPAFLRIRLETFKLSVGQAQSTDTEEAIGRCLTRRPEDSRGLDSRQSPESETRIREGCNRLHLVETKEPSIRVLPPSVHEASRIDLPRDVPQPGGYR